MNAIGTKTDISTSVMPTIGAVTCRHRLLGGIGRRKVRFLLHDALDVLDHDDGVIDHDANSEHHREQRHGIGGIAQHSSTAKLPTRLTGTATTGMIGGAQAAEKQKHHDDTRMKASNSARMTALMVSFTNTVEFEDDARLQAFRKSRAHLRQTSH